MTTPPTNAGSGALRARGWAKVRAFSEEVRLEQSIFALPIAYATLLLAEGGLPSLADFLWITLAMVGIRNFGMAINRVVDRAIDARNPRTAGRALVSGHIRGWEMTLFLGVGFALVLLGVAGLLVMRQFGTRLAILLPARLRTSYDRFHQGAMGSFGHLPLLLVLSVLVWFTEVGRLYFVIQALDMSTSVSFSLVLFVTLANAILTTVPITPGGLGIVEPGIMGLLTLSLARSEALSVTLLDRSISYLSIVVLGGVVFLIRQATRSRRSRVSTDVARK